MAGFSYFQLFTQFRKGNKTLKGTIFTVHPLKIPNVVNAAEFIRRTFHISF